MFVIPEQDPSEAVATARFLEANGINGAWIGDSPPMGWGDVYATLALCASATTKLKLWTGVTNALTRHASVTANAIATVQRLSGGRAGLGIGTGDSAVRRVGFKPAKLQALADYIAAVRSICGERGI